MIDVLKRLAELDAVNPNVTATMLPEQSLATVSNIEGETISECGMMGGADMPSHSPASISVTANSGEEVSDILRSIMTLAGVDKQSTGLSPVGSHQEIEIGAPHALEPADDMSNIIGMVDKMNGADTGEVDIVGDEGEGEFGGDEEPEDESWDNSPNPEVEPHDYGDKQVSPKPQGLKQRPGDNPYKPADESINSIAAQLMREYTEFKASQLSEDGE